MTNYSRSLSEPRERRPYSREQRERSGGGPFWNGGAPRNSDADSWRRSPASEHPTSQNPPPSRSRDERDRSRGRVERPPSRGSTGEYRPPRDFSNGNASRYPSNFRGRGRGGRGRNDPHVGDMNGRNSAVPYRGAQQPPPKIGPTGQGTQFFTPLTAPQVDTTRFDASEAMSMFAKRWQSVSNELNDSSLPLDQRPFVYKSDAGSTNVWNRPKVHVQSSVFDFLVEVRAALERDQHKSQGDVDSDSLQQPPSETVA